MSEYLNINLLWALLCLFVLVISLGLNSSGAPGNWIMLGKSGDIFFPKLNKDNLVNFKEITEDFFQASGRGVVHSESEEEAKRLSYKIKDSDPYPVYYFESETSGEKPIEEFYTNEDLVDMNLYTGLGVISNSLKRSISEIEVVLDVLKAKIESFDCDKNSIIQALNKLIPSFNHIETGKSLDQKM